MAASNEVLCWMKQMLNNGLASRKAFAGAGTSSQPATAPAHTAARMSATDALVTSCTPLLPPPCARAAVDHAC